MGDLALDTVAYLRYSLRRFPKPEQRRIMRKFGFVFRDINTVLDEEEPEFIQTKQTELSQPKEETVTAVQQPSWRRKRSRNPTGPNRPDLNPSPSRRAMIVARPFYRP